MWVDGGQDLLEEGCGKLFFWLKCVFGGLKFQGRVVINWLSLALKWSWLLNSSLFTFGEGVGKVSLFTYEGQEEGAGAKNPLLELNTLLFTGTLDSSLSTDSPFVLDKCLRSFWIPLFALLTPVDRAVQKIPAASYISFCCCCCFTCNPMF